MRKSRIGIRKRQKKVNLLVILFFLVILPVIAVKIGSRITEWWVLPTINTDGILNLSNNNESEDKNQSDTDSNVSNTDEETEETTGSGQEKDPNLEKKDLNSLSVYVIQIASVSDNNNIQPLIEELSSHEFPHVVYKIENSYKVYTFGATKRENVEKKLDQVREIYPDSYISQMDTLQKQINYSNAEDKGTDEVVKGLNSLTDILIESSDVLYKFNDDENKAEDYKKVLNEQQKILNKISEDVKNAKLPSTLANADSINKMIEYQEKNISESLKVIDAKDNAYKLQNHFLDNLFRTIEVMKK